MKKKAFNFKLMSTSDKVVELKKIKSKFIVLYFYPKDNTSGCTIETNDFNKLFSKFKKYDYCKRSISSLRKSFKNFL